MNDSLFFSRTVERFYSWALLLYPSQFRLNHGQAMVQTLRDALGDHSFSRAALLSTLFVDLIQSVAKENLAMMRETFARPSLIFNSLILAALSTLLALAFYAIPQQVLRQGANDPQLELAGNATHRLEQGAVPADVVPTAGSGGKIDMDSSLSPFVIAYDEQGNALASSAELAGTTPAPPSGVFEYVRSHGEERVTWQPRPGVRIAAVVKHVAGSRGGFVLAGRNMREIEAREEQMGTMARYLWISMLGVIAGGTFLFGWFSRTVKTSAA